MQSEPSSQAANPAQSASKADNSVQEGMYAVASAIDRMSANRSTPTEEQNAREDLEAQKTMADWAVVIGIFTGCQVLIGLAGTIALLHTLNLTREANDISHAGARAWVRADLAVTSGLTWREDRAAISGVATLKNVGKSPATGVVFLWKLEVGYLPSAEVKQREFSEWALALPEQARPDRPRTLFPGDEIELPFAFNVSRDDLMDDLNSKPVQLIGCVQYRTSTEQKTRQTGFIYGVLYVDEGGCLMQLSDRYGDLAPHQLTLGAHPRAQPVVT